MTELGETDEIVARRYFLAESNMRTRGHAFALTQRIDWQTSRIAQLEAALREIAAGLMPEDSVADHHNRYELCAARLCGIARRAITAETKVESDCSCEGIDSDTGLHTSTCVSRIRCSNMAHKRYNMIDCTECKVEGLSKGLSSHEKL